MQADLIVTAANVTFAVREGRFTRDPAGAGTEVLDMRDKFVLPGFIDAHIHLTGVGLDLQCANLIGASSFDDVLVRIERFASSSSDEWLFGNGWDQNLWPGKAWPHHRLLSERFPQRPVVLRRIDTHALLVNEAALRAAGITASTPDPQGGAIVRDARGDATGVLIDNAMRLVNAKMPRPSREQLQRAVRAAIRECNRYGVTSIAEPGVSREFVSAQEALMAGESFTLRNYAMLADDPQLLDEYFAKGPTIAAHDGRLWIRAVKIFADGALGSRGAALFEPYCDDCKTRGFMTVAPEYVEEVTRAAIAAGFQVCTHAIGDRANHEVLGAYEAALRGLPKGDYRLRVEHAQIVHEDDIPRFAELGVIPSMQSCHHLSEAGWSVDRLGTDRLQRAYAFRKLIDAGSMIANGTDAPVEPVDTRRTFYSAITANGKAMTREEALQSMTTWAAYACFLENDVGSITPGKYADFVVMDRDWMTCSPDDVLTTRIEATYFSGIKIPR